MKSMKASWFDAVTSFFTACILMLAGLVFVLGVIWLTGDDPATELEPGPVIRMVSQSGGPRVPAEFDTPTEHETRDLIPKNVESTLQAVTNLAGTVASTMAAHGSQLANGNDRQAGPDTPAEGDGAELVPPHERWSIILEARNQSEYASQLDHFGIELGVIGKVQGVDVVGQLTSARPRHRRVPSESETRLYFMWTDQRDLQTFEQRLLRKANVATEGRTVLRFVPNDLEQELRRLETQYANDHGILSIKRIRQTTFQSVLRGADYQFIVVDQQYVD